MAATTTGAALNRQWLLGRRPEGMVAPADFSYREAPVPRPDADEILVRTLYVSFDPAMRAFLNGAATYAAPQGLGEVMRAGAIGQVVESRAAGVEAGELVSGVFGWQDYAVTPGNAVVRVPPGRSLPTYLSALGGTGLTAYFGMLDVARIAPGETVLVSGAAGATGSTAAQIAKIKGCRTIGIAGGAAKAQWLLDELALDAAIDYKADDVGGRLAELCPDGIHAYFDNVGGAILEAAIGRMALHGRIALCGMISGYNAAERPPGPSNLFELITRRLRMEGFLIMDYAPRFEQARRELDAWLASGQLKDHVDVQEGFENIPRTFLRIFTGENVGKQMLKIADPS